MNEQISSSVRQRKKNKKTGLEEKNDDDEIQGQFIPTQFVMADV